MKAISLIKLFFSVSSLAIAQAAPAPTFSYHDYGEIRVAMTSSYKKLWVETDISMYHPVGDDEFRALGSIISNITTDVVNNKRVTILVALNPNQKPQNASMPALKEPLADKWRDIWFTKAGASVVNQTEVWRPTAPDGYTCLGDVGTVGLEPKYDKIWCYEAPGTKSRDGSFWEIMPGSAIDVAGSDHVALYAGTFHAAEAESFNNSKLGFPDVDPLVFALPFPKNFIELNSPTPNVSASNLPYKGQIYDETLQAQIVLPLTAFYQPDDPRILRNIRNPFYNITKRAAWQVEGIWENYSAGNLQRSEEIEYGLSNTESQSMEHTTGISLSASYGTSLASFSVSLNYQFTHSSSSSFTEYHVSKKKEDFAVPPNYATVLYCKLFRMQVAMRDGAVVHQSESLSSGELRLAGVALSRKKG
ncbi:hypothetical protein PT974_01886 [Cladobotryum mycophilum]|uniref:Uncharacterized protein n=1 Tax=Cladobotryum mycophilum TaxID=491253 RepID=A0ABR0SWK0_9HYPO